MTKSKADYLSRIRDLAREVRAGRRDLERRRRALVREIRAAVAMKVPYDQIAKAAGITKGRVSQIVGRTRKEGSE